MVFECFLDSFLRRFRVLVFGVFGVEVATNSVSLFALHFGTVFGVLFLWFFVPSGMFPPQFVISTSGRILLTYSARSGSFLESRILSTTTITTNMEKPFFFPAAMEGTSTPWHHRKKKRQEMVKGQQSTWRRQAETELVMFSWENP